MVAKKLLKSLAKTLIQHHLDPAIKQLFMEELLEDLEISS